MREEIIHLLVRLQEGYTKREHEKADEYAKDLFVNSEDMVILGTSDAEWCLGFEAAKGLLISDWKHWGDVNFDLNSLVVTELEEIGHFRVYGYVRYNFKASQDTYESFLKDVKEYFSNPISWMGKISDETKLTTIAWELSHLLTGEGKRYDWQFCLSGVVVHTEEGYRFNQLQFAIPTTYLYPDERFWEDNYYIKSHENGAQRIISYLTDHYDNAAPYVIALQNFRNELNKISSTAREIFETYFYQDACSLYGTSGDVYEGKDQVVNGLERYKEIWDSIEISSDEIIIQHKGDVAWFITQGVAKKTIGRQRAIEMEIERVKSLLEQDINTKDKLARINLSILTMINEQTKGEEFLWPIRVEGIIKKTNDAILIVKIGLSYPCNIILEGKNHLAKIIAD